MLRMKVSRPVGYAGIAILVVFVFFQMRGAFTQHRDSRAWPSVPGEITSAFIKEVRDENPNTVSRSPSYYVEVRYVYDVKGTRYTGNRIRVFRKRHATLSAAESEMRGYPVGDKVDVFYDPAKPATSVLVKSE